MKQEKICIICKKKFIVYGSIRHRPGKFCSLKCRGIGQSKGLTTHKHTETIFECQYCKKPFVIRNRKKPDPKRYKYCSKKCFNGGHDHVEITFECQHCKKSFTAKKRKKRKYCSNKCSGLGRTGLSHRNFSNRYQIQKLKKKSKCVICNYKRFIENAHIVPASKNGTYSFKNILFFCPNHHKLYDNNLLRKNEIKKLPLYAQKIYLKKINIPYNIHRK